MEKIRFYVHSRKIRIRELGRRSGYHPTFISRVFNGSSKGSPHFVRIMMVVLKEIAEEKIFEGRKDLQELKKISLDENMESPTSS